MSQAFAADPNNMDKMKKLLNSPVARKKPLPTTSQYFGVLLEDLVKRENRDIPRLLTTICTFLHQYGLDSEGIFRVNGNSKEVERLKNSFDKFGDVELDDEVDDVMAVAGLLKLFLRELPESLIPQHLTRYFVSVHEEHSQNRVQYHEKMMFQLKRLSKPHYDSLRFLLRFLVLVSQKESLNKMSAVALGIVFGPNLFRCATGIAGLKEQGVTNHIVVKFITDYDTLFLEESEISPYSPSFNWKKELAKGKTAPPRPPPPRRDANSSPPIPSPRKSKMRHDDQRHLQDNHTPSDRDTTSDLSTPRSRSELDDEYLDTHRSSSPFGLESDRSECAASGLMSPMMNTFNALMVENAISSVVTEHLFGGVTSSVDCESPGSPSKHAGTPVPPPRRRKLEKAELDDGSHSATPEDSQSTSEEDTLKKSVKHRVQQFEDSDTTVNSATDSGAGRPKKQRPISEAFQMFESRGIIIGPAPDSMAKKRSHEENQDVGDSDDDLESPDVSPPCRPKPQPRPQHNRWVSHNGTFDNSDEEADMELGVVQKTVTLSTFKRTAGPRNRQKPSRQNLRSQPTSSESLMDDDEEEEDDAEEVEDFNHNATKPSTSFLDKSPAGLRERDMSPEASPINNRKIYVPPLDLSILHEHGDGTDPIPAEQGPSISLQKAKSFKNDDGVMVSPRMSKLKKKSSVHQDTDVPPSPPTEQSPFSKRLEDGNTTQIKMLTKKIQSCKRRIKVFEEEYEHQHGYRPSQTDKASRPDIKKCMQELSRARKDLRTLNQEKVQLQLGQSSYSQSSYAQPSVFTFETPPVGAGPADGHNQTLGGSACHASHELKEELENERQCDPQPIDNISLASGKDTFVSAGPQPQITETRELLLQRLGEKRREGNRPEDLTLMTREQIQEEKLAVQKALLHYENIHGRPATRTEKDLMKPLYDRYRNVKRMLAKPLSPRDKSNELQSVPEDLPIEFASPTSSAKSSNRDGIYVPTADGEEEPDDFMVTKDMRLLRDTVRPPEELSEQALLFGRGRNLHELSISELTEEQYKARNDKKRLRRVLKEFEDEFMRQNGRKVLKEDRDPMDAEYYEYKQVKAKLKLLDALLSKHSPMSAY